MNDAKKYPDQKIEQKSVARDTPQMPIQKPKRRWGLRSIGRRWRVVFLTTLIFCAVGIPAIWLLIERSYVVSGAIRVDPIISSILTGQDGVMSNYTSFVMTKAMMITSPQVVSRVADDLSNKGLEFFEIRTDTLAAKVRRILRLKDMKPDPEKVLKDAILDELITAGPVPHGEHIRVTMKWPDSSESIRIVDSFIRQCMILEGTSASSKEESNLATLEEELKLLAGNMEIYQKDIGNLAKEYGTKKLLGRYDMNLERVGKLLGTLTEVEARRIYLQTQVNLRDPNEDPNDPQEWVALREDYINRDPAVSARTTNIITLEQELIAAKQELAPGNPQIKQKEELLAALRASLEEQQVKARENFNTRMEKEKASLIATKFSDLKRSFEQAQAHEDKIKALLDQEDAETIDLGQKNLAIQESQDKLALAKGMYDTISRRIQEVKMNLKRPARIYVDMNAHIAEILDNRAKYTLALVFGAMALGMLLAMLRDRAIAQRSIITG